MDAYYGVDTLASGFTLIKEYEFAGRPIAIMCDPHGLEVSAIDAESEDYHGRECHRILAVVHLNRHQYYCGTVYSEAGEWRSPDPLADVLIPIIKGNIGSRLGIALITGDTLAQVKRAEAEARQDVIQDVMARCKSTFERMAHIKK
ncbi:hypothetical protein ACH54D_20535 [Atlantibacter hermannii]|uniref:hypothetical protein n=1 Tax=Atlantibacter hermannii TaxID=565 RepID=UPI00324F9D29